MAERIIEPWQIIEMRWTAGWLSEEDAFEDMDLKRMHEMAKDDIRELLLKIKELEAEREDAYPVDLYHELEAELE